MVSTPLLIYLNKGLCKRKDPHPGLPSRRKKILSNFFSFLISCVVHVVVWVSLVLILCLFVCFCFVLSFFNKKNKKNTKTVCVCVYWYLCTLDDLWNKVSQLCITCSLDEHLYAQLSNVSFLTLLCDSYDLVDLLSFIS